MTLYYLPTCPHCHRVINGIEAHGLTNRFNFVDASSDSSAQEALFQASSEGSVPCLVTPEGRAIVGDTPIIEYLETQNA